VLRSSDAPISHGDAVDSDGDITTAAPPSEDNVELETWLLKAQLYSGRDLPRMDRFGKAGLDAYLKLQCGSANPVKSANKASRSPDWNQELVLKMVVPPGKAGWSLWPSHRTTLKLLLQASVRALTPKARKVMFRSTRGFIENKLSTDNETPPPPPVCSVPTTEHST